MDGWTRSSPYLPSFMRSSSAQVVLAHPPTSLAVPEGGTLAVVFQLPDMTAERAVFFKEQRGGLCISAPVYCELGENAVHDHQVFTRERCLQLEQKVLLLPG